jgi:hypothetical protein
MKGLFQPKLSVTFYRKERIIGLYGFVSNIKSQARRKLYDEIGEERTRDIQTEIL